MNQYTPNNEVNDRTLLYPVKENDYNNLILYAVNLGINNAFCQEGGTVSDSFVPSFNYEGIKNI